MRHQKSEKIEAGPLVLAIDTTTPVQGLAVSRATDILATHVVRISTSHTETLLSNIERLLSTVGVSGGDLDRIGVVNGPGSFTGIRIGMATARSLADCWEIPVLTRNALELHAVSPCFSDGLVCPILDAHRKRVYLSVFERQKESLIQLESYQEMTYQEAAELLSCFSGASVIGSGSSLLAGVLPHEELSRYTFVQGSHPTNSDILASEVGKMTSEDVAKNPLFDAFYIRPPDVRVPKGKRIESR